MTLAFETPKELHYTEEHEWIRVSEDGTGTMGITDFAQDALTDVVYVELPLPEDTFGRGDAMAVVESVKSVSDVYAPVGLTVAEVNEELEASPELVNDDPYGEGWMVRFELQDASELEGLLDAAAYDAFTAEDGGA